MRELLELGSDTPAALLNFAENMNLEPDLSSIQMLIDNGLLTWERDPGDEQALASNGVSLPHVVTRSNGHWTHTQVWQGENLRLTSAGIGAVST